jgi:opacity protein-like surface antigen
MSALAREHSLFHASRLTLALLAATATCVLLDGRASAQDLTTDPPAQVPYDEPPPSFAEPEAPPPSGFYVRGSGMWVDPQNDARLQDGSGTISTDDDFGLSLAIGYSDLALPLSFEVEYAYRQFETDDFIDPSTGFLADNRIAFHTISANLLFDQPSLIGPIGVYAGAGIGVNLSELRISTSGESGSTAEVSGEGFFWQAMAGLTLSLDRQWQLYGGVRWADPGTFDDQAIRIDAETFNIEFGVRFYF